MSPGTKDAETKLDNLIKKRFGEETGVLRSIIELLIKTRGSVEREREAPGGTRETGQRDQEQRSQELEPGGRSEASQRRDKPEGGRRDEADR